MADASEQPRLHRVITLPLLIAYGVGTMIGGGFYALLGRVAGYAGMHAPIAILVSAAVALVTALSFSELASRLPYSAGEPRYVNEAFGLWWLSVIVGWGVIATGVVSAATLTRAFVGFWQDLLAVPTTLGILLFVTTLTSIAARGILESVWLAMLITVIEVTGLLWVLAANAWHFADLPQRWSELMPSLTWDAWSGTMIAAFLAFYAFIGFEDMVNEAEEVQHPRRNLPRGILCAVAITTLLYLLIAAVAVLSVTPQELAASRTPLALLVSEQGNAARVAMTYISLLAGVNGALVQIVMSSRVAYGMSDQGLGPRLLAVVHKKFRTPVYATLLMGAIILSLALWLPLELLAKITSGIMLINFTIVNAALVRIKLKRVEVPEGVVQYPILIPILGCALCAIFIVFQFIATPA